MYKYILKYHLCLLLLFVFIVLPCKSVLGACEERGSLRAVRLLQKVDQQISSDQSLVAQQLIEEFKKKYPQEQYYLIDYHLGNLYGQTGQLKKALAAYDAALTGCDQDSGLWQNRGKIAWDLKLYAIAADSLFRAYELDLKKEPSLLFHTAIARMYANQKEKALDLLETLLEDALAAAEDVWLETYINLCLELKQADRALVHLSDWQPQFESRKVFWRLLAVVHIQQQKYEKGAANLKVLAAFESLKATDKKLLADLLLQINIPLEAAELYEELLLEKPDSQQLYEKIITCYRLGLQPQKALETIERALSVYRSGKLMQDRGEILFEQGHYEQAFQAFDDLVQIDPDRGIAYLYQGYCALRMEDRVLARKVLIKASGYKKEKKEARRLLDWLQKT